MELVLGGLLLFFLGLLLGGTWTTTATQSKINRLAKERRRLNDEWEAVRTVRRQQTECTRCASPLYERNWYFAPTGVEERTDNDRMVGQRIG
ncbi:MAG: hypothetical protein ACRDRA_11545 [Pseudonocardiaceae bacterium]